MDPSIQFKQIATDIWLEHKQWGINAERAPAAIFNEGQIAVVWSVLRLLPAIATLDRRRCSGLSGSSAFVPYTYFM